MEWELDSVESHDHIAERPYYGLGHRTPDEIWSGAPDPIHDTVPLRENDPIMLTSYVY